MNWKFWNKKNKATTTKKKKKSKTREWVDAILFAVIAATLIRTFFIEAYTIPTPSMERSLLVGDFLFVSKLNYGARTPMTPIAFPFAHHTMPILGTKAYWDGWELGYHRLPGFGDVKTAPYELLSFVVEAIWLIVVVVVRTPPGKHLSQLQRFVEGQAGLLKR